MALIDERVDRIEQVLIRFMERTEQVLAAIHEEVAEIRASNARTDRRLLELQQQADEDRRRADEDRRRADEDRRRAEKERKDFNRRLAEITDSQGLMIENMVWPNLRRIAGEVFKGDPVITSGIRLKRRHPGSPGWNMEIDLLAASPTEVLVCEAKSKVDAAKAAEFLEKLQSFSEYFPEFSGHKLLPMIASIAFDDSVLRHLTSKDIYALGFGDETMELLNAEALQSR